MSSERIDAIWVESIGGISTLCGNLREHLGFETHIAGYGIAGQLAASAMCAQSGLDCGLVRPLTKEHGTRRRFEAPWHESELELLLCSPTDARDCRQFLAESSASSARMLLVDQRIRDGESFSDFRFSGTLPPVDSINLGTVVQRLDGDFTLSSGEASTHYWDTLPATHEFAAAMTVARACGEGLPVGVGHGGAFLGVVAALLKGERPAVADPYESVSPSFDAPIVVLDDFATSGASLRSCVYATDPAHRSASRLVAAYALEARLSQIADVIVLHSLIEK